MDYFAANEKLVAAYLEWYEELKEKQPQLLGDDYSNPYYCSIPADWYEAKNRVLIVGEEGHGDWGCGKWGEGELKYGPEEIDKIQTYNWSYLSSNLYSNPKEESIKFNRLYPGACWKEYNSSRFWTRARNICREDIVCAWTNADKIHRKKSSSPSCALTDSQRKKLHSLDHKILQSEIGILDPTHVFFFGWRRKSFETDLPDVFEEFYRKDSNGHDIYSDHVAVFRLNSRWYIFTKHPGARNLPGGYRAYEQSVLEAFSQTLN